MSASTEVKAAQPRAWRSSLARRAPAIVAVLLVVLGVIAVAVRLDAPSDGTVVSSYGVDGVVVDMPSPADGPGLQTGDLVIGIAAQRLANGLGYLARPQFGQEIPYDIVRAATTIRVTVGVDRTDPYPLLAAGWGNLVFVLALAGLATALFLRRPEEPSTTPLLLAGAGLLGSTLAFVAGIPALALATGGPVLWLYSLCVIAVYSFAWGPALAFALQLPRDDPALRPRRTMLAVAYAAPLVLMLLWMVTVALIAANVLRWFDLVFVGQTAVVAATLVTGGVLGILAYRRSRDPLTRSRLRWLAGGSIAAGVLGLAGWHLPQLITGEQLLPSGAIGLSGLPFVMGIAVALRRHRLFDIERLANRSLVYVSLVAILVAGYAALVAVLAGALRLSGTVAAAIAAAAAALVLAPLRNVAQRTVNRLMYGDRDDPAGVLARLGTRMQAVMLPGEVLPVVVETVAQSLRLPYVAIDLADGTGEFRLAAEHGVPVGTVHSEALRHHGDTVGRLRVSERGRDDPLEPADMELIGSLAREVGPAVQAVRLHEDLLRSRAEVVALREDERRRLRRDLHDGLGPTLAAIRLKAGLAAREVPPDSTARGLLGEIDTEVTTSLADVRRLVEALRPPALDELGLLGAVRSRAAALAGAMEIDVAGSDPSGPLPAAIETAAYRIVVEAMTNAVRHSDGMRCTVSILIGDDAVELSVRDDGNGLEPDRTPGVGLRSMRERAAEVGGTLSIQSPPKGGTVITARLPLNLGGPVDQAEPR
ncbi:MAG TPA: sensor histidine kinase [Propionibacteriaceae bacterium]|nr:sensor histidine kinase [Propionibacteriaceae bacterium]